MEGRNKKILVLVLMMSSVLLLEAADKKESEKAGAPKASEKKESEKAGAPKASDKKEAGAPKASDKKEAGAPKASDKKEAGAPKASDKKAPAPAPGGGGGNKWECQKFIEKIVTSKEKIHPAAKEACGRTENTQTCERTVMEMNHKEGKELNPKTITALQLKAIKDVLALASKDCQSAGKDKANTTCAGSYKKGGDEMATVTDGMEIADINAKITVVQGVMKHIQSCQTQLDTEKVDSSPLKEINNFLLKSGENTVALATAIATKSIKVDKK